MKMAKVIDSCHFSSCYNTRTDDPACTHTRMHIRQCEF